MGHNQKIIEDHPVSEQADEFLKELEVDVMARTLWGEARSEGTAGMEAVVNVIMNRVAIARTNNGTYWWGDNVITVCQKPYQFSCWNPADPNRAKMMAVDNNDIHFATAMRISRRAVYGGLPDMTYGATHYHTVDIMPFWAKGQTPVFALGRHKFYRIKG